MQSRCAVLVLAGGESGEHEISLLSARSMLEALGSDHPTLKLDVQVITREGRWLSLDDSRAALGEGSARSGGVPMAEALSVVHKYDVVFPLLHGPHGEDGTVQGMLELAGLPCVGSGTLSSALCMDKLMSKQVLASYGVPQVPHVAFSQEAFERDPAAVVALCTGEGGAAVAAGGATDGHASSAAALLAGWHGDTAPQAPWFVKPSNMGSSVGISLVERREDLPAALRKAFKYDRRVVVEQGIKARREFEVAVLGNEAPKPSVVGEITYNSAFYDYETKYTDGKAQLTIPAKIEPELSDRIRAMACQVFLHLDCAGYARVDFLYDTDSDQLYLNEVNTIPGFTPFSMFPMMWEATGVPYAELVAKMVDLASQRRQHLGV